MKKETLARTKKVTLDKGNPLKYYYNWQVPFGFTVSPVVNSLQSL